MFIVYVIKCESDILDTKKYILGVTEYLIVKTILLEILTNSHQIVTNTALVNMVNLVQHCFTLLE